MSSIHQINSPLENPHWIGGNCHIRWIIRRDMPEVLDIEKRSFEFAWPEDDFIRVLRQRNCIGLVAELPDERVAGFVIYELGKNYLHLLNFAVHPEERGIGIGSRIIEKMVSKLSFQRRNRIVLEIRESNVAAQLFFQRRGFRCVSVLRDFYLDTEEDAYVFEYRYGDDELRGEQPVKPSPPPELPR